ncbi:carbohydrate-binding family 9-like protein [Carboxylicivirga sp. RSCT41]|uniref:carbohydrate-binding family 9-like protein n=1 Tax=Carboxylicivirga agarovorans TaxID=3417570 RepID=UPI003D32C7EE
MNQLVINEIRTSASGEILFPDAEIAIAQDNWNYPAEVQVMFGMAYDKQNFYLKYLVEEAHPKAVCTETNGPVWEDSCVEFFIAFNDKEYYNLEFNCIGTRLAGLGTSNTDREWLKPEVVETIITKSSLGNAPINKENTPTKWEMDIIIPKTVFGANLDGLEAGNSFNVNFYKCGDKQKQMHFLSWNAIDNEQPNFHLPQYFGRLILE